MLRIVTENLDALEEHEEISIGFEVLSRLSVEELRRSNGSSLLEIPAERRFKDYDANPAEKVSALARALDTSNWAIIAAFEEERRVGGIVIATDTPGLNLLGGRIDLAVLLDVRVHPEWRGVGIGRALFLAAVVWARSRGCTELMVETQDVNVAACRFYKTMGCLLGEINEDAYPPSLDETQLIWRLNLD